MSYCTQCGYKIGDDFSFCPKCGLSVSSEFNEKKFYGKESNLFLTEGFNTESNHSSQDTVRKYPLHSVKSRTVPPLRYNNRSDIPSWKDDPDDLPSIHSESKSAGIRPAVYEGNPSHHKEDDPYIGWFVLGFFLPPAALVIYLSLKNKSPRKAVCVAKGGLIMLILLTLLAIVFMVFVLTGQIKII